MYNGWSYNFLGLWVKCRTRPPTHNPPRVSKRIKSYAGLYINGYLVYICCISTLNELDICYYIYYRFSRLTFIYFLSFCRSFFYWIILYTSRVFHERHAAYSLRTLSVLRPSRLLTRPRNWSISSTSYLPVLIVSRRYVVTSTLIRLLICSKAKSLSNKRTRYTYIYLRLFVVVYSYFVCVFHWLATCVFHHWLIYLSFFFFVFT